MKALTNLLAAIVLGWLLSFKIPLLQCHDDDQNHGVFRPGEGAETWRFSGGDNMAAGHNNDNVGVTVNSAMSGHVTKNSVNDNDMLLDDIPIVVWWTKNLFPHIKKFDLLTCPNSKCYSTHNISFAQHPQTIAYYFYGTEFAPNDLPLPRLQKHLWALAHEESPLNNFALDHAVGMSVFNYTATYHRASDFPITTVSFPGVEFILNRPPVTVKEKNRYQQENGFAAVIYVQSHCEVPSDRDRYVDELMQYIKIDSYGETVISNGLTLIA